MEIACEKSEIYSEKHKKCSFLVKKRGFVLEKNKKNREKVCLKQGVGGEKPQKNEYDP